MIRLLDKFEVRDKNNEIVISLPIGSTITPIRHSYIPSFVYDSAEVVADYAISECYAIYLKSKYFFIPKRMCEIPKSEMFFYGDY